MSSKPSAYTQRRGIAAPLEPDSDSDFNPGEWIDEEKVNKTKKGRKSNTKRKRLSAHPRSRVTSNLLLEIFGNPGSDTETEKAHTTMDEDDTAHSNHSEEDELVGLPKTLQPFFDRRNKKYVDSSDTEDETSVTESESEVERAPVANKRKSPGHSSQQPLSKRPKPSTDDSSVTESESEEESPRVARKVAHVDVEEDSVTESESESELPPQRIFRPRPGFALKPGQAPKGALVLDPDKQIQVPASINTYLRDYQREGVEFFYKQYRELKGGILGNEMGLVGYAAIPPLGLSSDSGVGKTIQVISFLSAIMNKKGDNRDEERRHKHISALQDGYDWIAKRKLPPANGKWPTCLIIAPSSVVPNWKREFETWGYFEVGCYIGVRTDRAPILKDFELGRLDVLITSFDTGRSDIELLYDLPFSCIIIDEAHRLKNAGSQTTLAFNEFVCTRRFALTGTIIQNDYEEMWPLLDWCNPGAVGTLHQWKKYVSMPLKAGQSNAAGIEAQSKAWHVSERLVHKFLPMFFLRRTKDSTIKDQIPTKTDSVVFCPLSPAQTAVYRRILATKDVANLINKNEPCDCDSGLPGKECHYPFDPANVFRYISVLIKLSNHLALILPSSHDTPEQLERNRHLSSLAFEGVRAPTYTEAQMRSEYCGKWEVLHRLLTEWRKDKSSKVLIFTKSTKLLDILQFYLSAQNYAFVTLSGDVQQKDRMPLIDRFQNDPKVFVFLISTLAGGTGLNLTAANKVVIFDPNWNPAHDLQAMDRAHRFGQTRDVCVYRLLGAGSIEELIYARQLYKQQQMAIGYEASNQTRYFSGVQGDKGKQGELFGLANIFKLHEGELATKLTIEKANLAELDWALKNMKGDPKSVPKKASHGLNKTEIEVMESAIPKEESAFKGLGALLFEDAVGSSKPVKPTEDLLGSMYSHQNDRVLAPSRLEEERARAHKLQTKKLQARKSESKKSKVIPNWPPVRKHKKPSTPATPAQTTALLTDEEKKGARTTALILLRYINRPEEMGAFAATFAHKTEKEQRQIIAELDDFVEKNEL